MRQRIALAVVALAVFLTALDQTVVVTALVNIVQDVQVPITALDRAAWIVSGYLLGYVIAMPLMGRVADVFGRRRVFIICLLIFALGSVISALAPLLGGTDTPDTSTLAGLALIGPYWLAQQAVMLGSHIGVDATYPALNVLVAGRFLQALGGGALVPVALAVASDAFGRERRGVALGIVGAVAEAGGVLGPMWGAWVTTALGWQWIFWLNLPVVALLLAAGVPALGRAKGTREPVDVIGAVLFGAAIAALTLGLGAPSQAGALSLGADAHINPALVVVSLALLLAFAGLELRRRFPVVEVRLFRRAAFGAAAVLSLLIGVALIVAMVDIPIFAATVLGWEPIASGLALLRLTALIPVGALAGGWLTRWLGCRVPAVAGCALTALGLWLMHLWPAHVDELAVTLATTVAGLGFGLVIAPITTSAVNAAGAGRAASASAVVTALRMVGMIVGLAALTAWGLSYFKTLVAARPLPVAQPGESAADFTARLQVFFDQVVVVAAHQVYTQVFAAAAVLCLVAALPALLLWRGGARREPAAGGAPEGAFDSYVAPLA
ncbi:MAG TPA: MFS transporter [Ktedonobacterales bacterium]|nr:MFS transporter [Ktedonobacterales bacterium]